MTETYEEFKSQIESEICKLKAENKKILKLLKKLSKDQEPEDKPKRVNGFSKPMKLSQSLCEFLGVDSGTEMARTDVTKKITEYVKSKGLQNPENKRELILDDKLKTIIHNEDNTQVTFFNLQKYMSKHYIKEGFIKDKVPMKVEDVEDVEVPQTPKSVPSKVKKVVTRKVKEVKEVKA